MRLRARIAIVFLSLRLLWGICCNAVPAQVMNVAGDPIPGVTGYGVKLGLNSAGRVAALLVYHGKAVSQELAACTPEPVVRNGDIGTIATTDLNFDGFGDLLLQVGSEDKNATFCVWLFEPKSKKYVLSPSLSRLVNPYANPKTKTPLRLCGILDALDHVMSSKPLCGSMVN